MLRRHMMFLESLHYLDRRHRADIAVKVSAVRHGIDVRPKKDARQRRVPTGACSKDVSRRINARLEPGLTHRIHGVVSAANIGIRIGHAAYAIGECSSGGPSVDTEIFKAAPESRRINAQGGVLALGAGQPGHSRTDARKGRGVEQFPPIYTHDPAPLFLMKRRFDCSSAILLPSCGLRLGGPAGKKPYQNGGKQHANSREGQAAVKSARFLRDEPDDRGSKKPP